MIVKFRMLKKRDYNDKTTGERRVAHLLEATLAGVGTGDYYITEEVYDEIDAQGFQDGDSVRIVVGARLFRGNMSLTVEGVEAA